MVQFDALRALAILCIIIIHVFSINKAAVVGEIIPFPSYKYIYTQFLGLWFKMGVGIFLMLSGALSLGRNWEIKDFLARRIPRIVLPFLFWGITLSLFMIGCSYVFNFNVIPSYDLKSVLLFIYNSFMAKSVGFDPYWFFWMILETYLIMPIFNKWALHADLKEIEYFLAIWLVTCLFDFTLFISFPIKLTYFTSPIGLVVLGYYLRHTKRKILNNPYFGMVLVAVSCILMSLISFYYSTERSFYVFDRYFP